MSNKKVDRSLILLPASDLRPNLHAVVISGQEREVGTNPVRRGTSLGERGAGIGIQLNCR
jgi:hypothetical protein